MKPKSFLLAPAILLAVACQAAPEPALAAEPLDSLEGHVEEVRADGFVLDVDDGWLIGFEVDAATRFALDGAPAGRDEVLLPGAHVRVHFRLGCTYAVEASVASGPNRPD